MDEQSLLAEVQTAKEAEDYPLLKEKMRALIEYQKTLPVHGFTDEELAEMGVDLVLLARERELAHNIKQAEQDGDFTTSLQLRRELVKVQHDQPKLREVK
jgi:hypothetical protein